MQLSQVLTLAFGTTTMAKVYNGSPIFDSVERPSNSVGMQANTFGTASAKRHPKALQARESSLYVCEHTNFNGACVTITGIQSGDCYNINGIWNDVISSTDTFGHTCTVWEHQGCSGDQSTVNGAVNWGYMNDKISSYRCFD